MKGQKKKIVTTVAIVPLGPQLLFETKKKKKGKMPHQISIVDEQ